MNFATSAVIRLRAERRPRRRRAGMPAALALLFVLPTSGLAQSVPSAPITTAGGRLTVSAQSSISVGTDDEGYFNYSTYEYSQLRLFRVDGTGNLRISDRISALGDLRVLASTTDGHWLVRPYAAFVRIRPWLARTFDIQAGLVPPVFGAFSRHAYESDNPLIGYPLAYQYPTSLRPDAVPSSTSDLLRMRGRGWLASYPVGNSAPGEGVPLVDGFRYQSGIEAHVGTLQPVEASVAWTSGALSTPAYSKGNGWEQISGRAAVRPATGLILGVSGSRGTFLSQPLRGAVASAFGGDQRALGFDVEYSRGHWLARSEGVLSEWRVPGVDRRPVTSLRAFAVDVEGRYRISPGLYAAARVDRLDFSDVMGPAGMTPWDAPVRRLEIGAGYSLWRNALIKAAWQHNHRTGGSSTYGGAGPYDTLSLVSAQLVVWF